MSATPGADPGRWTTDRLVSIAARLHERRLNQRLARYKLTTAALDAMEAVGELQPATATEVAAMLCVTQQSLGKVLRRMQSLGFLTKEPARDGRSAYLHLTPAGRDVLSAAENLIREGIGSESEDEREFRRQLEQHIRHLRSTERGHIAGPEPKERGPRTVSVPRHGQEQRTTHLNETGATSWRQQTGLPGPKKPFKGQHRP